MAKSKLLSAIADADQSDLDELNREIEQAESELEREIAKLKGRIESLKAAHRLIDLKLNGKKPRAKPQRRSAATTSPASADQQAAARNDVDPESLASQIFDLITREGSLPPNVLASMLKRSVQGINMAITKSGWFTRGQDGEIRIARAS